MRIRVIWITLIFGLLCSTALAQQSYQDYLQQARFLISQQRYADGASVAQKAIAADGSRWEAYTIAAKAYESEKLWDSAIQMLQLASDRAPNTIKASIQTAITRLREAKSAAQPATSGNAADLVSRGLSLYQRGDYPGAITAYRQACDVGQAAGCITLGGMYEGGHGVAQDYAQAMAFYRKACDGGNAVGCTSLGGMYEGGHGVAQDYAQAMAFYRKGCDWGNAFGCTNLGWMFEVGHGVAQDSAQAMAFYRKACDGGNAVGCTNLGVMYESGHGVAQDYAQAMAFYRKGCDWGNAFGCTKIHQSK